MRRDDCSSGPFLAGRLLLFSVALAALAASSLPAQEIHIRVLNARNGKPVAGACMSVYFGTWHVNSDMWAGTNQEGVAVLHFVNHFWVAESGCHGWKKESYFPSGLGTIAIQNDFHVDCQELAPGLDKSGHFVPIEWRYPTYSIKRILESGIAGSNICGKARAEAKPGELIVFARRASLLEKLRE